MKKILLFSPSIDGHEKEYAYYFGKYLSNNQDNRVYLQTSNRWDIFDFESFGRVKVTSDLVDPVDLNIRNKLQYFLFLLKMIRKILVLNKIYNFDIIHILYADSYLLPLYFLFLFTAAGKKSNLCITVHRRIESKNKCINILKKIIFPKVYKNVKVIYVHGKGVKENLQSYLYNSISTKQDKIVIIPYGTIPPKLVDKNDALLKLNKNNRGIKLKDCVTLLFFGTIRSDKGLNILVEVLQEINEPYQLVIAGKLTDIGESELLDMISPIQQNTILHLGFIEESLIESYFGIADFLVLPYLPVFGGQSGPLSLAASFGVPIITTNVGELGRTVLENDLGLVCEPQNVEELRIKILQALSLSNEQLEKFKNNGFKYSRKASWEEVVSRVDKTYALINYNS